MYDPTDRAKLSFTESIRQHVNIPFLDEDEDKINDLSEIKEHEEASEWEVSQPV